MTDRIPMIETLFWPETLARWRGEGLPDGVNPTDYFGLDRLEHFFGVFDHTLQARPEIIEERDEYVIRRNAYGAVMKESRESFKPAVMLEPGIRDRREWESVRERLFVSESRIVQHDAFVRARELRRQGVFVTLETIEPLWFVLYNTMGFERGLFMMASDPDLIEEMIAAYADFSIGMLDLCFEKGLEADALWLFSDLCYRNGMLFSPEYFRRFGMPQLKRYSAFCRERGLRFLWHSDGDVSDLIPLLIEAGVDAVHPLEARAGNDVRKFKARFGDDIAFIGNIDADIVAGGDRAAIEEEVAGKITVAKANGGYVYHMDHSVPPTVSLESYRFLLSMVRKYGTYK